MNAARFDSIIKNLTSDWEFDALLDFFRENAAKSAKQLEFCVYLADIGLLDDLHKFVSSNGLYNLKALADDPDHPYEKRGNAKILLNIYESEMIPVFERQSSPSLSVDANLLSLAQYADISLLVNYINKNKDSIFHPDQSPKTLMYLTYAINKVLSTKTADGLVKLLLDNLDHFKNISALRKIYITKLIAGKLFLNKNVVTFPRAGYNELYKLLDIIVAQKEKFNGAALLYNSVSEIIRLELKHPKTVKKLGSPTKAKVAVCISGMYRCGNAALDSIYKNVIEPLDADVFFHSWNEMQDWPGLGGAGDDWLLRMFNKAIFDKCPVPLRSKKYFKEKFPRTFAQIDTPLYSIFDRAILPEDIDFKRIELEDPISIFEQQGLDEENFLSLGNLNQAKMFYGIYKAHELAVDYEKAHALRYDYFVRCRPDIGVRNILSVSALESVKANEIAMDFTKIYGPQDQFWYARRDAALTLASIWAASVEANALSPFPELPQMRAHALIFGWMTHNHLQPVRTPVKRDMTVATAKATRPDISASLADDFAAEASDLSRNQDVLEFFCALQEYNKK